MNKRKRMRVIVHLRDGRTPYHDNIQEVTMEGDFLVLHSAIVSSRYKYKREDVHHFEEIDDA